MLQQADLRCARSTPLTRARIALWAGGVSDAFRTPGLGGAAGMSPVENRWHFLEAVIDSFVWTPEQTHQTVVDGGGCRRRCGQGRALGASADTCHHACPWRRRDERKTSHACMHTCSLPSGRCLLMPLLKTDINHAKINAQIAVTLYQTI